MPPHLPPSERTRVLVERAARPEARYVLYWMSAHRRTRSSAALERAAAWARALDRPLLVVEALAADYEHASTRIHDFVLAGMADNNAACAGAGVRYARYVEPQAGAGVGLLEALAGDAAVVVTDDHPTHPRSRLADATRRPLDVHLECVDACGLLPMRTTPKAFATAHAFRRHVQKELPHYLEDTPQRQPLRSLRGMPAAVIRGDTLKRWPELRADPSAAADTLLASLPIDQDVRPTQQRGGSRAAQARLKAFLAEDLPHYDEERNHPDHKRESGLSPYLHFGHIGAHEVFEAITAREGWTLGEQDTVVRGARAGWWGMSTEAEAFIDQLVTWRELSFNTCVHLPDTYASLDSLPDWAKRTLQKHALDPRPWEYTLQQLDEAATHDEIWNAAQRQLRDEGQMHNYLRMLWGKKILEWSPSPAAALESMIHLNDRYALDGRDPNSYAGILWVLGRHDRAWGPERPIFGTVRYMSSEQARKKLRLKAWLAQHGPARDGASP